MENWNEYKSITSDFCRSHSCEGSETCKHCYTLNVTTYLLLVGLSYSQKVIQLNLHCVLVEHLCRWVRFLPQGFITHDSIFLEIHWNCLIRKREPLPNALRLRTSNRPFQMSLLEHQAEIQSLHHIKSALNKNNKPISEDMSWFHGSWKWRVMQFHLIFLSSDVFRFERLTDWHLSPFIRLKFNDQTCTYVTIFKSFLKIDVSTICQHSNTLTFWQHDGELGACYQWRRADC